VTWSGIDFALRQNIVGIGQGDVRSAFGERALHGLQEIDWAKLSQDRGDSIQQRRDSLLCDDNRRAGGGALKFVGSHEILMRGLGPSLFANVEGSAASVEHCEALV
jgi:hypothetical protein